MTTIRDIRLDDGRTLTVHDSHDQRGDPDTALTVLWHHGSPQTGALLAPLVAAADERHIRLISYGRPGYGGSTTLRGRTVASAAADAAQLADALGAATFAVMGASGGGPHALACAALLPERVEAVALLAGLAPSDAEGLDFFGGMAGDGASLRAAIAGRGARELYEQTADFDPEIFTARDYAALECDWAALGADVARAASAGAGGLIDDDLAFAMGWGFDVGKVTAPALVVQGGQDRVVPPAHAAWLAARLGNAELWLRRDDGHISVLDACPAAMDWLVDAVRPRPAG